MYNSAKVIANYLKPLWQDEYKIADTQSFPSILKEQTALSLSEEYDSYFVESLFTKIPAHETISCIINEIHQKNNIK